MQHLEVSGAVRYIYIYIYIYVIRRLKVKQNRPVCWSIVVKEKPNVGSPFFVVFPSNFIHKATKDIIVSFFIHSSNSCQLYRRILKTF